jgi:microcystin-dependent protein
VRNLRRGRGTGSGIAAHHVQQDAGVDTQKIRRNQHDYHAAYAYGAAAEATSTAAGPAHIFYVVAFPFVIQSHVSLRAGR